MEFTGVGLFQVGGMSKFLASGGTCPIHLIRENPENDYKVCKVSFSYFSQLGFSRYSDS